MSYFLQFSLLKRLGSLAIAMLLVPSMLVIPATAQASPRSLRTGAVCTGAEVLQPNDPDVQALRSLISRYNITVPNVAGIGERPITRYEFAIALNTVFSQIEQKLASGTVPSRREISTLYGLQENFTGELRAGITFQPFLELTQQTVAGSDVQELHSLVQTFNLATTSKQIDSRLSNRYDFVATLSEALNELWQKLAAKESVPSEQELVRLMPLLQRYEADLRLLHNNTLYTSSYLQKQLQLRQANVQETDVQALRSLIQKFKLTTPAEVAEQPINQLQFIQALEKVLGELQQKTTAKQISPSQKDWLTVFNLTQRFASDSAIIGNIHNYAYAKVVQTAQGKRVSTSDLQTLQTLAQKYGSPYPSMGSRGAVTRYEFAAGLNAALDRINELIASGNADVVSKNDLPVLQRLQEEYAVELAMLRGRVDALEARTSTLERQQFSTTTKLSGEVIFPINQAPLPNPAPATSTPKPMAAPPVADIAAQNLGQARTRQTIPGKPLPPVQAVTPYPGGLSPQDRINRPGTGNTEDYNPIAENPFLRPGSNPLSTFSIDVDTASYSNVRRFLTQGQLPPKDAVRIEEMINYFPYDYPQPEGNKPFSITTDVAAAPWNPKHKLVQIGLKGRQLQQAQPSNLVFLVDVSGSMDEPNKLPLVKQSLCLLVNELTANDRVTLVVYAGNAGLVLPPTSGNQKQKILAAIDQLKAGGSTAGGEGIELAYQMAQQNFLKNGNNRVILATDGDFNVGVSSDAELVRLIEQKRDRGIFLTVLGFGTGNYKDAKMEQLADKGNGNYAYIDTLLEAKKVLVNDLRGTLFAIAKDVKIQVEFNPAKVQAYRLIGYENRLLRDQDFNDDTKDAGEIGAGHTVTALYEVIPTGMESDVKLPSIDPLKYQSNPAATTSTSNELMQVKLRYKKPKDSTSQLISQPILDQTIQVNAASNNLKFSAAVVMFGMLLRNSEFKGAANINTILQLANQARGKDQEGYRSEFISLVDRSKTLFAQQKGTENATNNAPQRDRL